MRDHWKLEMQQMQSTWLGVTRSPNPTISAKVHTSSVDPMTRIDAWLKKLSGGMR